MPFAHDTTRREEALIFPHGNLRREDGRGDVGFQEAEGAVVGVDGAGEFGGADGVFGFALEVRGVGDGESVGDGGGLLEG